MLLLQVDGVLQDEHLWDCYVAAVTHQKGTRVVVERADINAPASTLLDKYVLFEETQPGGEIDAAGNL